MHNMDSELELWGKGHGSTHFRKDMHAYGYRGGSRIFQRGGGAKSLLPRALRQLKVHLLSHAHCDLSQPPQVICKARKLLYRKKLEIGIWMLFLPEICTLGCSFW